MIIFSYPTYIKEVYLDTFGHMNNATYLTLLEEARWEIISLRGFSVEEIKQKSMGPTILEINMRFRRELKCRDNIIIESQMISYERKIAKMSQKILRDGQACFEAEITFGLFSLSERKLIEPTPEWLYAVGYQQVNA